MLFWWNRCNLKLYQNHQLRKWIITAPSKFDYTSFSLFRKLCDGVYSEPSTFKRSNRFSFTKVVLRILTRTVSLRIWQFQINVFSSATLVYLSLFVSLNSTFGTERKYKKRTSDSEGVLTLDLNHEFYICQQHPA